EENLPTDVIDHLRNRHVGRAGQLPEDMDDALEHRRQTAKYKKHLIEVERDFIYELLRDGKITDEARRRIEYELDLEEASLANRRETEGGWL
ncbi:MAG: Na+/H+ antiporter, partial [Pseudolabrys sp.]|nr:Na+/H+ antiporter [Pseudolabrys sp.]